MEVDTMDKNIFSGDRGAGGNKARRIAFKMQLQKGFEIEYKNRHDALWPELTAVLKEAGIGDYSIFLEENSGGLFGVMKIEDPAALEDLAAHPVMKKWWASMKDIMVTQADHSPVSIPLKEVFHLP